MDKDPKIFLQHILESIEAIEKYMQDLGKTEFYESGQIQDAVIRRCEVIGEATKNLPQAFRDSHPNIPWQEIAGLRDKLIHEYFGIDLELLLEIVNKELPELKRQISSLLLK